MWLSLLYVLTAALVYLEPVLLTTVGTHCRGPAGYFDAGWYLGLPLHELMRQRLPVRVLALLAVYGGGGAWLLAALRRRRRLTPATQPVWRRWLLVELFALHVASVLLHAVVCFDGQATPVDSGAAAVEVLFGLTPPAAGRWLAPRLTWLLLLTHRVAPPPWVLPLTTLLAGFACCATQQLGLQGLVVSCLFAWGLAAEPSAKTAHPSTRTTEGGTFTVVDDADDDDRASGGEGERDLLQLLGGGEQQAVELARFAVQAAVPPAATAAAAAGRKEELP